MNYELMISLTYNISLLLALSIIYTLIPTKKLKYTVPISIFVGIIIGLAGIGIMVNPFQFAAGIVFDVRSILISISGLFFGLIPTAIAALITSLFRILQGGAGAITGVSTIIFSAAAGLAWRYFRFEKLVKRKRRRWAELYVFGAIVNIGVLLCMFIFPISTALHILENITLPTMIIYPLGTALLGMILLRQIDGQYTILKLRESEEKLNVTLMSVGDGVIATDKKGLITLINEKAESITGWDRSEAIGKSIEDIFRLTDEYTGNEIKGTVLNILESGKTIAIDKQKLLVCKNGVEKPISDSISPIRGNDGEIIGAVIVMRDVTEAWKRQKEMGYLAFHDGLTGLYNRSFFDVELRRLDTGRNLPILIIIGDLNGLKLTNDAFGHAAGDILLKEMAKMIKAACRKDDIVARWGGDEFIVLIPGADEKMAATICKRIEEYCSDIKLYDIHFSISIGSETKYKTDEDPKIIIKRSEEKMYRKKTADNEKIREKIIKDMLRVLHEKYESESEHSIRVSELCAKTGKAMGFSRKEINELKLMGQLHDVGKVAIDENILKSTQRLSDKQWGEVKRHSEISYRILSASGKLSNIAEYVLKHHERPDGSGYPKGIKGKDIPIQAKILAVANAYDSMTGERVYKARLNKQEAIAELKKNSGTQFDYNVVKTFIEKVIV